MEKKNDGKYIVLGVVMILIMVSFVVIVMLDPNRQPLELIDESSNVVTEILGPINTITDETTTTSDMTTTMITTTTKEETTTTATTIETTTTEETSTTTMTTTTANTTTEEETTTTVVTTTELEITTEKIVTIKSQAEPSGSSKSNLKLLGSFKGTYYAGKKAPCKGGSGRTLIDCSVHGQGVKGSIACKAVYNKYGYNKNGRTKVYVEVSGVPSMSGWYYVDDCCGSNNVVDFYYYRNGNCQFRKSGVVNVKVYI